METPREHHTQVPSAPVYAANTHAAQAITHDRSPMQDEENGFPTEEKVPIPTNTGAQAQSYTGPSFHRPSRTEPASRLPNQAFHTRTQTWKTIIDTKGIQNYTNFDQIGRKFVQADHKSPASWLKLVPRRLKRDSDAAMQGGSSFHSGILITFLTRDPQR